MKTKKMKTNKKIFLGVFFVFVVLLTVFVSAQFSSVNPQFLSPGASSFSSLRSQNINAFPIFNERLCTAGQDFILQIAPFGCEPSVVRSDLLEDQNVPVFCQISATKINPLIDVEVIESIVFSGQYSRDVAGVGFHPARAAVKSTRSTLLNSPVLGNIGYAVIVLRQNPNESSMPDFVEGNLTADIRYDIENAFGVGQAQYYLPLFDDNEWENKYLQYGFWNGRGFLRADVIDDNGAVISVYLDKENRLSSFNLEKGQTSGQIYLPGFYCNVGLKLRLNSLEDPDTRAKLIINGEIFEVANKERFLENKCQVVDIDNKGLNQEVEISCRTDDGGERFDLTINPKIKLEFPNANEEGYSLGDLLYVTGGAPSDNSIYLGYVGTKGNSNQGEDLFIYLVSLPRELTFNKDKLTGNELSSIATIVNGFESSGRNNIAGFLSDVGSAYFSAAVSTYKYFTSGQTYKKILVNDEENIGGKNIKLLGLAGAKDSVIQEESRENYESAMEDYRTIIESFPEEIEGLSNSGKEITFGEVALINSIDLANFVNQKKTAIDLCNEFEERYPESDQKPSICGSELKISNSESAERGVVINGRTKIISFEGISEPTLEEYSAEVLVRMPDGKNIPFQIRKNQVIYLNDEKNEFIQLLSLDENSARFRINLDIRLEVGATLSNLVTDVKNLEKDTSSGFGSNYVFTLTEVNLKKVAKVSVLPNIKYAGTEANISFKIGIEKREIQLSPDKIKEKLENLNKSIEKWESTSETLGDVVKGFNGACLATGAMLTAKNYFENLDGRSIARQEVMRGDGGWTDICSDEIKETGKSLDSCFLDHSPEIDSDVDAVFNIIQNQETITDENLCDRLGEIRNGLGNSVIDPRDENKKIEISGDISAAFEKDEKTGECEKISLSEARNLERLNLILDSSASEGIKNAASVERYKILSDTSENVRGYAEALSLQKEVSDSNLNLKMNIRSYGAEDSISGFYDGDLIKGGQIICSNCRTGNEPSSLELIGDQDYPIQIITYLSQKYLLVLDGSGSSYHVKDAKKGVYEFGSISGNTINVKSASESDAQGVLTKFKNFIKYDRDSYENKFKNPEVNYFETEPYKGSPAIVPFDTNKGWYAAVKQTLPGFGNIRAYDDSGRVASFWVCNVGENGRAEFNKGSAGTGDDICQQFNPAAGQIYGEFPGLDKSETRTLVGKAIDAIEDASRAYKPGLKGRIRILNELITVGKPAVDVPDFQCQDFMSPKDCLLLFNVCDPVVCPSSRCNLGGTYHVSDVVQSGIVGSTLLCLPNAKEKIIAPVCLSGIKAGMDGLISVQKNYQNCLQENLETGQTIGICDEIHSIYLCDFFWSQAAPLSELVIPKVFEAIKGQGGTRGGGEYLGVQSAWQNARNSVDFFSNYYATNSFDTFKLRSVGSVGGAICNNFVSASYPSNIDILAPESPPQYTAWFEERAFTTATVPPISQYKVFYHIFAGENIGAYYSVFLKSPEGTSFYQTNPILTISRGFISVGDFASETTDFTAPSGYKELCVRVNQQEECGFGKVTTSFALDYIQDKYLEEQASQTDIKSERECISGTPSAYSLLNPNLQAGVSDVVDPSLYNQGIIRICSTDQPGKGTDATRWKQVGTCDDGKGDIKCWIDEDSVRDVIQSITLEEGALEKINEDAQKLLKEGDFIEDFQGELDKIDKMDHEEKINKITDSFIEKALLSIEKARLFLKRGDAYRDWIEGMKSILKPKTEEDEGGDASSPGIEVDSGAGTRISSTPTLPDPQPSVQQALNDGDVISDLNLYSEIISGASALYSVEESIIKGIILQESKADKDAVGDDGFSYGLMQVTKGATTDVKNNFDDATIRSINLNSFETDILDSKKNIYDGTAYYSLLQSFYSGKGDSGENLKKITLIAYNWGRGNVDLNCQDNLFENCQNIPSEVLQYASNVLEFEKEI